jgi:hypothetical protein
VNPVVIKQTADSEQLSSTLTEEVKDVAFYDDVVVKSAKEDRKSQKDFIKKEVKSDSGESSEESIAYSSMEDSG